MIKQILSFFTVIALSALVVLFMPQAQQAVQMLVSAHDWVAEVLTNVFNGGNVGNIARELTALISIPLVAGLVPALFYFLIRKRWLGCFMEIIWIVWLLQTGALVMVYAGPATAAAAAIVSPSTHASQPKEESKPAEVEEAPEPEPAQ